jgi:hypothetical protein
MSVTPIGIDQKFLPDVMHPLTLSEVSVTPEMSLLLACLRWPITNETRQLVVERGAVELDWDLFQRLVTRHRVFPLAEHALRECGVILPVAMGNALRAAATKASWGELRLAGELRALLTLLGEAGIKPIILKGLGLAIQAYGKLGMRYNRDIDLLVTQAEVPAVCGTLEKAGFERIEPPPNVSQAALQRWLRRQKDIVYSRPERQEIVEIHWRLFDNPHLLRFENSTARGQVSLAQDFCIETLPKELDLIFMCVHGAHHAWSRLKWIADLNAMFTQMTMLELIRMHEAARASGVHRATAQAMLLCARLLGLVIPAVVLVDARQDWRIRVLDRLARHAMLASGPEEIEKLALGSTAKNISHYLVSTGFRYVLSEAYFDLTDLSAERVIDVPSYLVPFVRLYYWGLRHYRTLAQHDLKSKT